MEIAWLRKVRASSGEPFWNLRVAILINAEYWVDGDILSENKQKIL